MLDSFGLLLESGRRQLEPATSTVTMAVDTTFQTCANRAFVSTCDVAALKEMTVKPVGDVFKEW